MESAQTMLSQSEQEFAVLAALMAGVVIGAVTTYLITYVYKQADKDLRSQDTPPHLTNEDERSEDDWLRDPDFWKK